MAKTAKKGKSAGGSDQKSTGFSDTEKAAMKGRARELTAEARACKNRAAVERAVLEAIGKLPEPDRSLGRRLHTLVATNAPSLWPKLWYGMPAYATPEDKVVCFFQAAAKFKTRYASFAFTDSARLDDGARGMWATGFGLGEVSAADEARIAELVKKAVS